MNKRIVLGVSGSIAVYKSLLLVRLLIKSGYQVKVVMTPTASKFVSPLSFATLSKNDVSVDLIKQETWSNHVELGLWADAMIIAPATATTLSKMASGQSDNMLVATYLSAKCPVYIAPAMDLDMWLHPSTQRNIQTLISYGDGIIPVGVGELASGLNGAGRMAEPEDILEYLKGKSAKNTDLEGKKVLITAGPTQEALDPVRFIGNHSSGKMGMELTKECIARGAKVDLILGPTMLSIDHQSVKTVNVVSAQQMYQATIARYPKVDIAIFCAAVADYRPKNIATQKIKKKSDSFTIELERTPDIAYQCGQLKTNQKNIGFALETNKGLDAAKQKLVKKNLDLIVLNTLKNKGAGFKHNTNKVSIVHKGDVVNDYELKSKKEVAHDIINELVNIL